MFSGIIEELGKVKNIRRQGKLQRLEITAVKTLEDTKLGDSIAVNGVCLTVVETGKAFLGFDVMPETFSSTNLISLKTADKINLERALKAGDRISGHFVTGHIDCTGIIRRKNYVSDNMAFEIAVDSKFSKYLVSKGSVSVDGISLTIQKTAGNVFWVYIIPHTYSNTALSIRRPSDKVNIEFDILLKKNK